LSLSHGARSQIIISNALGIPSLLLADYEYAKYPPLMRPTWEMVPSVIPDEVLCRDHQHIFRYPGIKEDAYVWKFHPNHSILQELGLSQSDVIVTVRPPATEAHYHNPESEKLFTSFMDYACQSPKTRLVLLPRNQHQSEFIRSHWPRWFENNKTVIPPAVVGGLNLIWHSDLLVSGGGTMNREATALGVPVYSIFLGAIGAIDRHLEQTGRLILIKSAAELAVKIRLEKRPPPANSNGQSSETLRHIVNTIEDLAGSAAIMRGYN
jgi:predicted glycosyltransferase